MSVPFWFLLGDDLIGKNFMCAYPVVVFFGRWINWWDFYVCMSRFGFLLGDDLIGGIFISACPVMVFFGRWINCFHVSACPVLVFLENELIGGIFMCACPILVFLDEELIFAFYLWMSRRDCIALANGFPFALLSRRDYAPCN